MSGVSSSSQASCSFARCCRNASARWVACASFTVVTPRSARARQAVIAGFVERRKVQFRHGGADQVDPRDELLELVVEQRQLEPAFAVSLGQAAARGVRVHLALVFVVNHEILKPHQLDGGHALVGAVEEMLDAARDQRREHLLHPLALHGAWRGRAASAARRRARSPRECWPRRTGARSGPRFRA